MEWSASYSFNSSLSHRAYRWQSGEQKEMEVEAEQTLPFLLTLENTFPAPMVGGVGEEEEVGVVSVFYMLNSLPL